MGNGNGPRARVEFLNIVNLLNSLKFVAFRMGLVKFVKESRGDARFARSRSIPKCVCVFFRDKWDKWDKWDCEGGWE